MSKKIYEKYFTANQMQNMKASTIQELGNSEERAVAMVVMMSVVSFLELVMIVAALLWRNEFTLFVAIVGLTLVVAIAVLSRFAFRSYKDDIKIAKEKML